MLNGHQIRVKKVWIIAYTGSKRCEQSPAPIPPGEHLFSVDCYRHQSIQYGGRGAEGQQVQCASGETGELCGVIKEVTDSIPIGAPMYLNPFFVEEMMGYPVGWTA